MHYNAHVHLYYAHQYIHFRDHAQWRADHYDGMYARVLMDIANEWWNRFMSEPRDGLGEISQ